MLHFSASIFINLFVIAITIFIIQRTIFFDLYHFIKKKREGTCVKNKIVIDYEKKIEKKETMIENHKRSLFVLVKNHNKIKNTEESKDSFHRTKKFDDKKKEIDAFGSKDIEYGEKIFNMIVEQIKKGIF